MDDRDFTQYERDLAQRMRVAGVSPPNARGAKLRRLWTNFSYLAILAIPLGVIGWSSRKIFADLGWKGVTAFAVTGGVLATLAHLVTRETGKNKGGQSPEDGLDDYTAYYSSEVPYISSNQYKNYHDD